MRSGGARELPNTSCLPFFAALFRCLSSNAVISASLTSVSHALQATKGKVLHCLALLFALPAEFVTHMLQGDKPSYALRSGTLTVGRVRLAQDADSVRAHNLSALGQSTNATRFACTGHALRVMQSVMASVKLVEPLLLVGEAGTGKTSLVQHVADQLGYKLAVINLSNQTDASDLLGGFKPMEVGLALLALVSRFDVLVRATWNRGNNEVFLSRVHKLSAGRKWANLVKAFDGALGKVGAPPDYPLD